jgi:hypothetical protein
MGRSQRLREAEGANGVRLRVYPTFFHQGFLKGLDPRELKNLEYLLTITQIIKIK